MTEVRPNLWLRGHQMNPPVARPAEAAELKYVIWTVVLW